MMEDETEYRGHRLVVIEQLGGGHLVEITPPRAGQTLRTMTYQSVREAIDEAKTIADRYPNGKR